MMRVNHSMPSPAISPQPIPSSPAASRSLLSRIRSPFGSKNRHIAEFYIEPDDPHKQYAPGDRITGSVVLTVIRPLRVTHISVCLHGYVQVYKNPNSPGDGFRAYTNAIATGKERRKAGGYFGNGFAQLFEDEVMLCGEGRLGEGTYKFNFILMFPKQKLPSSIDFERGTIAYMISATITRPTSISPTYHADRKVSLVENIDIAPIVEPRPRVISLEPVSRRIRAKSRARKRPPPLEGASVNSDSQTASDSNQTQRISNLTEDSETPGSPAPSDVSFDSGISSAGTRSVVEMSQMSASTSSSGTVGGSRSSNVNKVIHATVALDRAGFLRGDTIHIKISVSHMKRVRSRHGIIITLYRQARVDMHPIVPVANEQLSEDYYPRSKTGLGGLSLSEAGSHHLFRKDLSQSFASLIINPQTLAADVKAAVRVPEEAFPTISGVPGQMISFKYYVEVILDLQGKLAALDRYFPGAGASNHAVMGRGEDANGNVFSTVGENFVDTKEIRRDKSVVTCVFEVILGTRDSERTRRRELAATRPQPLPAPERETEQPTLGEQQHSNGVHGNGYSQAWPEYAYDQAAYDGSYYGQDQNYLYGVHEWDPLQNYPTEQDIAVPLPNLEQEEQGLSEKERLRRAEARLLPSQPPEEGEASTVSARHAPYAPTLPGHYDGFSTFPSGPSAPPADPEPPLTALRPSAPPLEEAGSSAAPSYEAHGATSHLPPPTDDKHELQRRMLENERSAPDTLPNGEDENGEGPSSATPRPDFTPSAPMLDDEFHIGRVEGDRTLPKYER